MACALYSFACAHALSLSLRVYMSISEAPSLFYASRVHVLLLEIKVVCNPLHVYYQYYRCYQFLSAITSYILFDYCIHFI